MVNTRSLEEAFSIFTEVNNLSSYFLEDACFSFSFCRIIITRTQALTFSVTFIGVYDFSVIINNLSRMNCRVNYGYYYMLLL